MEEDHLAEKEVFQGHTSYSGLSGLDGIFSSVYQIYSNNSNSSFVHCKYANIMDAKFYHAWGHPAHFLEK